MREAPEIPQSLITVLKTQREQDRSQGSRFALSLCLSFSVIWQPVNNPIAAKLL